MLLAGAYVLAPFAAIWLGDTLSGAGSSDSVAGAGVGLMFFLPATVHIAYGKPGHGVLSFVELAGVTAVGIVVGGALGAMISSSQCDPEVDSDSCDFAIYPGLAYGAAIGGVLAYSGFAVYDVLAHAGAPASSTSRAPAPFQLSLSPLPAPRAELAGPSARGPLWGGLQLGLTGQW